MTVRITYYYRDVASTVDAGWTENFYLPSASSQAGLDNATQTAYITARRGVLSRDYTLTRVRSVLLGNRFDNASKRYTTAQGRGTYVSPPTDPSAGEQPWDALLIRMAGGTTVVRNFPLRGIPQGAIGDASNYNPTPLFRAALNQWATVFLQGGSFYIRVKHPISELSPVSVVAGADGRSLNIGWGAVVPPNIAAPKSEFRLSGVVNATPFNHLWRTRTTDLLHVYTYPGRRQLIGVPAGAFVVESFRIENIQIDSLTAIRGMKRSTGRPSDQLAGRSRPRRA